MQYNIGTNGSQITMSVWVSMYSGREGLMRSLMPGCLLTGAMVFIGSRLVGSDLLVTELVLIISEGSDVRPNLPDFLQDLN